MFIYVFSGQIPTRSDFIGCPRKIRKEQRFEPSALPGFCDVEHLLSSDFGIVTTEGHMFHMTQELAAVALATDLESTAGNSNL